MEVEGDVHGGAMYRSSCGPANGDS
jgi:hypothetical protein